ncbi:hypothetical protein NKH80_08705 [Mesorhizobium sp. M0904]|uniref:hypothetical protein n=1 Tax=Mesorhizobium sp. M0904 TaxID=2957022 RepID=UPI0033387782
MTDETDREPARDPQELERLLISRQWIGDIDGMAALFEPHAVIDSGGGQLTFGREAIRALFAEITATGRKFQSGDQRPGCHQWRPGAHLDPASRRHDHHRGRAPAERRDMAVGHRSIRCCLT